MNSRNPFADVVLLALTALVVVACALVGAIRMLQSLSN